MYRSIINDLKEWKQKADYRPLIITGPRQVGKTYIIQKFGKEEFNQVIEINFQDDIRARTYFSASRSADDFLDYISLNYSDRVIDENTLIFLDEIQICPELITSLKFIGLKLISKVICSGSMLGVEINRISSFPVGYVDMLVMHPMTFTEFLIANNIPKRFTGTIRSCIDDSVAVPDVIHDKFTDLFSRYLICGGMPEAVSEYLIKGIAGALKVNRRLMRDYELDIAHYADAKTKIKAQDCFRSLPLQLSKENRKFQYKLVKEGYNARYYEESLSWLKNAGLILDVHRLKRIDEPLEVHQEQGVFKVYLFDTGLLVSQFDDSVVSLVLENALGAYKGVVYENITAQILNNAGYKCFYYEPNTSSEIDFIINYNGRVVPIEVKGGIRTKSTSFDNFIKNHNVKKAIRFSKKNIGISEDGITHYLPHYTMEWVFHEAKI